MQFLLPIKNVNEVPNSLSCPYIGISDLKQCALVLQHRGILASIPEFLMMNAVKSKTINQPSENHRDGHKNQGVRVLERIGSSTLTPWFLAIFATMTLAFVILDSTPNDYNSPEHAFFITPTTSPDLACDAHSTVNSIGIDDTAIVTLPPFSLKTLCAISLTTSSAIQSVWLVTESGALISLRKRLIALESNRVSQVEWLMPLPSQASVTRHYYLIMSDNYLDQADVSSFEQYVIQTMLIQDSPWVSVNERLTLDQVSAWFNRQRYEVKYWTGSLIAE